MSADKIEITNAVIESVSLTSDDHGCLSAWLHLNYGGSGQGFGGYVLYLPKSFTHHKLESVARALRPAGAARHLFTWETLPHE